MITWLKNEPVFVSAVLALIVAVASVFRFDVTAEQLTGILSLFGIVTVPAVRSRVTPTRKSVG